MTSVRTASLSQRAPAQARRFLMAAGSLLCVAAACLAPRAAHAAPPTWLPNGLPTQVVLLHVEELKGLYLDCDRASMRTVLDVTTAGACSMVAEELRHVGFDGRFEDLYAWWRSMRDSTQATQPAPKGRS